MNQFPPPTTTVPNIDAYWQFAADSSHAGKIVAKIEGEKIKVAPKLPIGRVDICLDQDGNAVAVDTDQIVDHFKEALCHKYGKEELRDFFSESQEQQARCNGLTHELVKEVKETAKKVEILTQPNNINAYWRFAANPKNAGKIVVDVAGKRLCFSTDRDFHPDSTDEEIKCVDHATIVRHFKSLLTHHYGEVVLRNLFSKAQEEEALYGLTHEIVRKVAENAQVVGLFQDLQKYQDSIKTTLAEAKKLSGEQQPEYLLLLARKIELAFSQHQSLVRQFQELIAADPANITLQIKAKSSYLTFQEKDLLEIARLWLKTAEQEVKMAIATKDRSLLNVGLSRKKRTDSILEVQNYLNQAKQVFHWIKLLHEKAPAVMNNFLETQEVLLINLERKIGELQEGNFESLKKL